MHERLQEEQIDTLAEELTDEVSKVIETAPPERRAELSEYAHEVLRQEAEDATHEAIRRRSDVQRPLGAFGLAMLLFLVGCVLLVAFPPTGVVVVLAALGAVAWGVVRRPVASRRSAEVGTPQVGKQPIELRCPDCGAAVGGHRELEEHRERYGEDG